MAPRRSTVVSWGMEREPAVSPEFPAAVANTMPVVALERTPIAHGLPYPRKIETWKPIEDGPRE